MSLRINSDFNGVTDPDAGAYIAAVEAADGNQLLEFAVGKAINDFVVGCKNDGIWNAIKASCILAGARKKEGAFIDLKTATQILTNNGFADGDYNRKTGLVGDGTSKYLNSNRANNADPQNNAHISCYISSITTNNVYIGCNQSAGGFSAISRNLNVGLILQTRGPDNLIPTVNSHLTTGFKGASRSGASTIIRRFDGSTTTASLSSTATNATTYFVFAQNTGSGIVGFNNGRIAFYSIGESLNLALLDTRVTLLMAGIAAGIDGFDSDAQNYISRVEAADGQTLEFGVKAAINQFITGCKADGIWDAIKASCILAGARTLSGALVPLAGTAPTNFNFVSGDYNRKTGLVGNGSTKYLNSNRNNNADPQNSQHMAVYISTVSTSGTAGSANEFPVYIGTGGLLSGAGQIGRLDSNSTGLYHRNRSSTVAFSTNVATFTGLLATARSTSTSYVIRVNGQNATSNIVSQTPANETIGIFRNGSTSTETTYSNGRLAFYSIGESLDLALLDTRVTALINAIAAAIP